MTWSSVNICRAHPYQSSRTVTTSAVVRREPCRKMDSVTAKTSARRWKTAFDEEGDEMVADDVQKGSIPMRLVNQAKTEEQKDIEKMKVLEVVERKEVSGSKVARTKWVATNIGNPEKPNILARWRLRRSTNGWTTPTVSIMLQLSDWNWCTVVKTSNFGARCAAKQSSNFAELPPNSTETERERKWHTWSDSPSSSSAWTGSQSCWTSSMWEDKH